MKKTILYDLGKLLGDTEPAHIKLSLTDMQYQLSQATPITSSFCNSQFVGSPLAND